MLLGVDLILVNTQSTDFTSLSSSRATPFQWSWSFSSTLPCWGGSGILEALESKFQRNLCEIRNASQGQYFFYFHCFSRLQFSFLEAVGGWCLHGVSIEFITNLWISCFQSLVKPSKILFQGCKLNMLSFWVNCKMVATFKEEHNVSKSPKL